MGNASSTRHSQDDTVDYGFLLPQGVYTGPQDWNHAVVSNLIFERRLAPFYRPLEDYEPDWDDDHILAARKEPPPPPTIDPAQHPDLPPPPIPLTRPSSKNSKNSHPKDTSRSSEAAVYRNAVECPICFLYFPPNINRSRCCDHPICTECFVQIKRSEPTPTHLQSDPACCPYCVQENFGVTYSPPSWRAGLGADNSRSLRAEALAALDQKPAETSRRKSFSADSREVVTIDQIRPDWEQKLAAVRAAVQRRANRRIIMRQVGDRLIPVGVTSGRIHPIGQELPSASGDVTPDEPGSRSRRRRGNPSATGQAIDITQFLGLNGQDIEELMVMEAMRLSLQEHEAAQQRQTREGNGGGESSTAPAPSSTPPVAVAAPATSPLSFVLPTRESREFAGSPSRFSGSYSRSRTPVGSPLIQSASSIALGLALPSSMRNPSPAPVSQGESMPVVAVPNGASPSPSGPTEEPSPCLLPVPSSDDERPASLEPPVGIGNASPALESTKLPSSTNMPDIAATLPSNSLEPPPTLNGNSPLNSTSTG